VVQFGQIRHPRLSSSPDKSSVSHGIAAQGAEFGEGTFKQMRAVGATQVKMAMGTQNPSTRRVLPDKKMGME